MRILLTGRTGQVGSALERSLAPLGEVIAWDRGSADFSNSRSFSELIQKVNPGIIVNAAAYTAVDRAETERATAYAVNTAAVGALAEAAKTIDALLVHFSTDYVFDGEKREPYVESDLPAPLSVYGSSKLDGERLVAASGCRHLIFRTSWVYGPSGRNFLRAILAAANIRPELRVVNDQRGAPTSSASIAAAIASALADPGLTKMSDGIYHLSAAGETTWYGFAKEIIARRGLGNAVTPISSAEYSAAARRPRNSMLDNSKIAQTFGIKLPHWREGLAAVLAVIH